MLLQETYEIRMETDELPFDGNGVQVVQRRALVLWFEGSLQQQVPGEATKSKFANDTRSAIRTHPNIPDSTFVGAVFTFEEFGGSFSLTMTVSKESIASINEAVTAGSLCLSVREATRLCAFRHNPVYEADAALQDLPRLDPDGSYKDSTDREASSSNRGAAIIALGVAISGILLIAAFITVRKAKRLIKTNEAQQTAEKRLVDGNGDELYDMVGSEAGTLQKKADMLVFYNGIGIEPSSPATDGLYAEVNSPTNVLTPVFTGHYYATAAPCSASEPLYCEASPQASPQLLGSPQAPHSPHVYNLASSASKQEELYSLASPEQRAEGPTYELAKATTPWGFSPSADARAGRSWLTSGHTLLTPSNDLTGTPFKSSKRAIAPLSKLHLSMMNTYDLASPRDKDESQLSKLSKLSGESQLSDAYGRPLSESPLMASALPRILQYWLFRLLVEVVNFVSPA